MNDLTPPNRCRIVLIAPPLATAEHICAAFGGGDVASLILPANGMDDATFQAFAEKIVPVAQAAGIAVIIAGDSRIAGRVHADGIHVEANRKELAETIERLADKMMVGAGGAKTRDEALELGEERPDYMFFGRFGYDNKPEPHPRNLSLGEWWAQMIQIPCIVMAGFELASVETVAATGAEFVALSSAVFANGLDPRAAVAAANALLDETAPRFED
ncbi:thiamine phosphate synthase [Mesorhizobium sp. M1C.F.Ca.ET.193.01.1.1]|uniref:thiamine phosphate synthase n=1 Tax=unclassified Mesorhizobium TaxID=325217 RepID=UPI000FD2312B|nr:MULTISPECIES: thiamine phosphate synthase [unclassified Mesorhizobium]TGT04571.1 thiamine phosphate synthase [bacterium M00.F.Ca.ET.177.01.1.1]TGQ57400.1 thiamine phosphate synthase [Mesorhizobium sp. M1C.F.Ca.ET.210.01.1.1]TGQ75857.1 thiamine phosphate synthase [Mesorhizobium sp. M1C.F.Ca.ET.212.01.1.1]TGR14240.1 thiamine phosphate synthase [Mesorhizobium sp. M1C.F.Ca.ET.204.01.1.1]TGR35402.1 thiamine phosphate synthase [Mesorhizobium sp. M1C.F.Ca.ET.196.01.1.1]